MRLPCEKALSKEQIDKALVIARGIKLGQEPPIFHNRTQALMVICELLQLNRKQVDLVVMAVQEEIEGDYYKLCIISKMKKLKLTEEQVDILLAMIKKISAPANSYIHDKAVQGLCNRSLQAQQIDMVLEEIPSSGEYSQWLVLKSLLKFNSERINKLQLDKIYEMIHAFRNSDWRNTLFRFITEMRWRLEMH